MANKGTLIVVAIAASLVLFVVLAVAPFIAGDSDHYNVTESDKAVGSVKVDEAVIVTEPVPSEPETEVAVVEEVEPMVETVEAVADVIEEKTAEVDAKTEQATETVAAKVEEMVEQVEQKVETAVVEAEANDTVVKTAAQASGVVHVVTAQGLKYDPLVIHIGLGDTVAWENMSSHDTQSIEGLIPTEAEAWHSGMGENYQRTFLVEGIYVYKCTPHFGAGMGGAIIVGQPTNLDAIKAIKVKGAAKRLVKKAIKAAESM
jgi:pseudoazurin